MRGLYRLAGLLGDLLRGSLLSFKEDGIRAVTNRARLVGQEGDSFLVAVEGREQPLRVPRSEVFALNQPHELGEKDHLQWNRVQVDYNSPLMKAKLAEAAIRMEKPVSELDLTRRTAEGASGQLVRFAPSKQERPMREVQADCIKALHSVMHMKYPTSKSWSDPAFYRGTDAGRLAVNGLGVDTDQVEVFRALLAPFANAIGVEARVVGGTLYRGQESQKDPFHGPPHLWLQMTYLPSLEQRVCDPLWLQIDQPLERAYSTWGDRHPANYVFGLQATPVRDDDVDL